MLRFVVHIIMTLSLAISANGLAHANDEHRSEKAHSPLHRISSGPADAVACLSPAEGRCKPEEIDRQVDNESSCDPEPSHCLSSFMIFPGSVIETGPDRGPSWFNVGPSPLYSRRGKLDPPPPRS